MLSALHVLPSHPSARAMLDRDYLWCLGQLLLDQEEELDALCPRCRAQAERLACPVCGAPRPQEEGVNPSFDLQRFERLRKGESL